MTTEYANQNAYDAIQVHGGSGFMKDYACERIYRDARITNIYEGTTQLQVVAAIRHVTTGTYLNQIREYQAIEYKPELEALKNKLAAMTEKYEKVVAKVTETKDNEYIDFKLAVWSRQPLIAYSATCYCKTRTKMTASAVPPRFM